MFITTPLVRYLTNSLYRSGKIDAEQRDLLILQDRQINLMISGVALVFIGSLFI